MLGTYAATIVERHTNTPVGTNHTVTPATVTDLFDLEDLLTLDGDHRARLSDGDLCLVARDGDDPVGVLWLNLSSHTDEYLGRWSMPSATTAYYNQLQVAAEYRRRGVARSLVLAALGECARRERQLLRAAVLGDNTASSALHEQLGFVPIAVVRGVRVGPLTIRLPGAALKGEHEVA